MKLIVLQIMMEKKIMQNMKTTADLEDGDVNRFGSKIMSPLFAVKVCQKKTIQRDKSSSKILLNVLSQGNSAKFA